MAGNSKEASQHAKEAGIFSASNVRAVYRLRGSLARCVHARHLRKRHHGADASSIARHRASECLHRSADEVCTPSRAYQTRYAVRESRVARTGTPGVASGPLSRNRRTGRRRRAAHFAYVRLCACCWSQVEERAHPRGPRRRIFLRLRHKNDGCRRVTPLASNEADY